MALSLHIIYASTSGHTEYVVDELIACLSQKAPDLHIERQKAELVKREDILRGDVVIFGSGTWNYGGIEGQLNMYMHQLLFERAKGIDLTGKAITFISLGDDRYRYTTRCTEHFMKFLQLSRAKLLSIPLIVVNEPYGQEERIHKWAEKLLHSLKEPDSTERKPAHFFQDIHSTM